MRAARTRRSTPGLRRAAGRPDRRADPEHDHARAFRRRAADVGGRCAEPAGRRRGAVGVVLRYARELERTGWVDRERYAWGALDALRAAPDRWGRDAVFFYGFDELTPLERDAVETLDRIAGAAVTVSLTYEAGHPALAARAQAVQELRPLAARGDRAAGGRGALRARRPQRPAPARARSVRPRRDRRRSRRRVVLLEAGGARAEAELIAARVLALVQAGVAPERSPSCCGRCAARRPLLERVLAEYGVPAAWGERPRSRTRRSVTRCAARPAARGRRRAAAVGRGPAGLPARARPDERARVGRSGRAGARPSRASAAPGRPPPARRAPARARCAGRGRRSRRCAARARRD